MRKRYVYEVTNRLHILTNYYNIIHNKIVYEGEFIKQGKGKSGIAD